MGKNPGQAQRVKDNAHASSSAKAAEMLQNLSNYGLGFGSDIPQIGKIIAFVKADRNK